MRKRECSGRHHHCGFIALEDFSQPGDDPIVQVGTPLGCGVPACPPLSLPLGRRLTGGRVTGGTSPEVRPSAPPIRLLRAAGRGYDVSPGKPQTPGGPRFMSAPVPEANGRSNQSLMALPAR